MGKKIRQPKITLNDDQKIVVAHDEGAILVSAGPGSGKTRVTVERIARMIRTNAVKPNRILATTFTKKAANEMNERLEAKGINTGSMSVQTTHSFCWHILKKHKTFKAWSIDEKNIAEILIKKITGYKGMDWKGCDLTLIESFIATCRNSLIPPDECQPLLQGQYADKRFAEVYVNYDDEMRSRKLITFDDMLYYGVRLLQHDQVTRGKIQGQYQYVMVDELQDSNIAQTVLADIVAAPEYNLMGVGDVDQAIYAWRGAVPEFMINFAEKYDAEVVTLGINYRCAPTIVSAAAQCITHNEARISKELVAARDYEMKILYRAVADTDDEAATIREEIDALMADNMSPGNMIVLMRTNSQSRAIEEEFIRAKIPFIVLGAISFYERKEIKDLLSYLRLVADPSDIKSGERAINRPFRYVGKRTVDSIGALAHRLGSYTDAVARWIDEEGFSNYSLMQKLEDFTGIVNSYKPNDDPAIAIRQIVQQTDYINYLEQSEGSDSLESSRALNIGELIASASRFRRIDKFIEHVDLQIKLRKRNQKKKHESRVQVMTIHKSKGTESPCVFILGANEGFLPHAHGEEEEERRLWYVAMTRAKDYLHISSIGGVTDGTRYLSVQPSRFIEESGISLTPSKNETTVADPGVDIESSSKV